ncbi:hypothetical protein D7V64_16950 [Acinetobacter cumulans]|uniref:Uncharacterized protein n=1 Tax=Acinetobacter cumulans TaxID=2136182 RepID=A0A3A8FW59_9GAMM|nr:hypothetical protein [Acinetobacter cumulans]RKG47260.1 hypothetical protein D7V64_16950 [Acinetobacter cumulans]
MNAVAKIEVMDWSRFTVDEWLKQYGAYVQTCRMKSGNEPDGLRVNQIYWLICENNKDYGSRKNQITCNISDDEAEEIRKLIIDIQFSDRICRSAKAAVRLFIEKNVRGLSLDQMVREFTLSRSSINNMIYAGKFYLAGHDKRLKID